MSELHFVREDACARANAPTHERLGDAALVHRATNLHLLDAAHFAEQHNHLHRRVALESAK